MVELSFNPSALKSRLKKLDSKKQLAFGVLCCERMLPNYSVFQRDTGYGDTISVRKALNFLWTHLQQTSSLGALDIKMAIELCESVIPDSEDFTSLYVTSAQDVCFAVCSLLDFLLENDVNKILQTAVYATDSIDLYVQEIEGMDPNDPQLEQKILLHYLMQLELAKQKEDIEAIELAPAINHEFLMMRKVANSNNGKSNLGIS